jgi:hypothetical protein
MPTRVGHGQQAALVVLPAETLIWELRPVDGLAAGAVALREVPALGHEAGDDAVEFAPLIMQGLAGGARPVLPGAQTPEILGRFRHYIGE